MRAAAVETIPRGSLPVGQINLPITESIAMGTPVAFDPSQEGAGAGALTEDEIQRIARAEKARQVTLAALERDVEFRRNYARDRQAEEAKARRRARLKEDMSELFEGVTSSIARSPRKAIDKIKALAKAGRDAYEAHQRERDMLRQIDGHTVFRPGLGDHLWRRRQMTPEERAEEDAAAAVDRMNQFGEQAGIPSTGIRYMQHDNPLADAYRQRNLNNMGAFADLASFGFDEDEYPRHMQHTEDFPLQLQQDTDDDDSDDDDEGIMDQYTYRRRDDDDTPPGYANQRNANFRLD